MYFLLKYVLPPVLFTLTQVVLLLITSTFTRVQIQSNLGTTGLNLRRKLTIVGLSLGVATSSLNVSSERSLSSGLAVGNSCSGVEGTLVGDETLFAVRLSFLDDSCQLSLRDKPFSWFVGLEISDVGLLLLLLLTAVM